MSNVLDDLFAWAKQAMQNHKTDIWVVMELTGTETNNADKSFVSYARASLGYHLGPLSSLASFSAQNVPVYLSDRHAKAEGPYIQVDLPPFDPAQTDRMSVEISQNTGALDKLVAYRVTVKSLTWNSSASFVPIVDEKTGVLYGSMGNSFVVIALSARAAQAPPK